MRDLGGVAGEIDAYDFQVFTDPAGQNLVAEKFDIALDLDLHFESLMVIRAKRKQHGVPVCAWLQ